MPITNTQDVWKGSRISVSHINPSIMEGERGHSSMFGQGSAVAIVRYAPTFNVQPSISGSYKIPSVLTCDPGAIDASPQATLHFQWQADGIDIPDEINSTLTTVLGYDAVELTCEVTAVNPVGVAYGNSNGITAEVVEPINNNENGCMIITGLNQEGKINFMRGDTMVLTGVSQLSRLDADSTTVAIIQGLESSQQIQSNEIDVYVYWQPTYIGDLAIINPSAETGDLSGWTVTGGTITSESVAQQGTVIPADGGRYFSGHTSGVGVNAFMEQTVDLDAGILTDVDNGLLLANMSYNFDTYTNNYGHQVHGTLEFLDASNAVLDSEALFTYHYQDSPWSTEFSDPKQIPALTRKIRVSFSLLTNSDRENRSYLDEVQVQLFKDEHQL